MKMPSYTPVWNWRNRTTDGNRHKIHICIYIDRTQRRRYHPIPTPLKVARAEWDNKPGAWVNNRNPYAFEINQHIKETLDLLQNLNKRYFSAKKTLTYPLILKELQRGNNTHSFNAYFEEIIKDPPEHLDPITMNRYRAALAVLNDYNPLITFNDLSDDLFEKVKKHALEKKKLAGSTTNGYFNAYKKVINWARKDHHITKEHEESIFEDIHIKIGKAKKDSLQLEEVSAWKNHNFAPKYHALERDRDLFLIQIYTGYYYNDLKELLKTELKKDHEHGHYFQSARYKNDQLAIVPLWKFKNAWPLIQKYMSKDVNDPYLFRRDLFTIDQAYNRSLKRIAKQLNWTRNVFNKMARQTNSQMYIRFGATRPILAKMLGQEKEESASHYFEVNVQEVIEGTKDINFDRFDI